MEEFYKDLLNFKKELKEKEKEIKEKIANEIVTDMKARMEDGQGTETWGAKSKDYKALKDSTIKKRKANKKLSSLTSPETSNQIETGRMHSQLMSKKKGKDYQVGFFGDRAEVAKIQEEKGRATLFLNDEDLKKIDEILEEEIDKVFNKSFK